MTGPVAGPEPIGPGGPAPASSADHVGEPEILVRATPADVFEAAAELIVGRRAAAIETRGTATFVTTGGSTPVGIYTVLASTLRDRIDWARVHFWWGDDRYVPRDHPLSNVQPADAILFASAQVAGQSGNLLTGIDVQERLGPGLRVPAGNIHPFACGTAIANDRGAAWCAEEYAGELRTAGLHADRGFPVFDVVLLGVGPDGHLLSVFPGSAAFDRRDWAMAIPAPTHVEPHVERVTLNPAVLDVARSVLMVTVGAGKAAIVGEVFGSGRDVRQLPAQVARRAGVTWVMDAAAAAGLPEGVARQ